MNLKDNKFFVIFALAFIILIPISLWLQFAAPCSWLSGVAVKDVPLRCLPVGK